MGASLDTAKLALMGYPDAARYLDVSRDSLKQFVYRRWLHSVKLPGDKHKYLLRAEVEWWRARRAGEIPRDTPSPWFAWSASSAASSTLRALDGANAGQLDGQDGNGAPDQLDALALASTPSPVAQLAAAIPRSVLWGAGGVAFLGMLMLLAKNEPDERERLLILAAIGALAFLLFAEMHDGRLINWQEKRRLDRLARRAQVDPEPLTTELERLLMKIGA